MPTPPRKKTGQGKGLRTINGMFMDVRSGAAFLGLTEKSLRARVARRLVPFRMFGSRIVLVRAEIEQYQAALEGCDVTEALANLKVRRGG